MFRKNVRTTLRRWASPRAALPVAIVATATLLSACGSGASSELQTGADGRTKIVIAYGAPIADHMVPSVTDAAGIFAKYGIDVDLTFLDSTNLMPSLISGTVQFVTMPAPGPEIAALNGTAVKQVAQIQDSFNALLVAQPPFRTAKDLDGHTVSIAKPGDYPWLLAQMAQAKFGIILNEVPIGNISDQLAAFRSGQVDSVGAMSPNQIPVVQQKVPDLNIIEDWRDEVAGVPGLQVVGYAPWMEEHRDVVVRVLRALDEGKAYYEDPANEATTVKTIASVTGVDETVAKAGWQNAVKAMADSIVPTVQAKQNVLPLIAEEYPEAATVDPAGLIDASYATDATT
jgi:ABC-type nitrate/sulfonate/bicarbonate transport system substrate-binding protein